MHFEFHVVQSDLSQTCIYTDLITLYYWSCSSELHVVKSDLSQTSIYNDHVQVNFIWTLSLLILRHDFDQSDSIL